MNRTLVLVPTPIELGHLAADAFRDASLCGFGPIAASARAAALLSSAAFDRVLLIGIAGSFGPPVGSAMAFQSVAIDGIGKGQSDAFRSAGEIGFPHWAGDSQTPTVSDELSLDDPTGQDHRLLTVCSASACADDAAMRRSRYPDADAEDMEGFGVALACKLAGVPLTIVRAAVRASILPVTRTGILVSPIANPRSSETSTTWSRGGAFS